MSFDRARKIADAVLFEGYILYPYRASARKNQVRWQFGVLSPRGYSEATGSDPAIAQTECLVEAGPDAQLHIRLRILQVQSKRVIADHSVRLSGDRARKPGRSVRRHGD